MHDNDNLVNKKNTSNHEGLSRNFTHITIPAEIWLRRDLGIQAKALWAELRSLHSMEFGGCYASEEYLCEFMQLKPRRLYELYAELKEAGLLETVSFDGRRTIRRAIVPTVEYMSAEQVCRKVQSRYAEKCRPGMQDPAVPSYIENKEENKEYITPPIPPLPRKEVANAPPNGDDDFDKSSQTKVSKKKLEFSPEVHEVAERIIEMLVAADPDDYVPPKNMYQVTNSVHLMIDSDGRTPEKIIETCRWVLSHHFWSSKIYKKNPAGYLRDNFSQFCKDMKSKPPQKERTFAPCSDDEKAFKTMQKMNETAL